MSRQWSTNWILPLLLFTFCSLSVEAFHVLMPIRNMWLPPFSTPSAAYKNRNLAQIKFGKSLKASETAKVDSDTSAVCMEKRCIVEHSIRRLTRPGGMLPNNSHEPFVVDGELVLEKAVVNVGKVDDDQQYGFVRAGPRAELAFAADEARIGIVTCGGLCPGLNNVIHEIVMDAHNNYGVEEGNVFGIRNGFRGFTEAGTPPLVLTPDSVEDIHNIGGTVLGSARGGFDAVKIIDVCEKMKINMLFIVGGDGTHAAAMKLDVEAQKRGLRMVVAGVPKTIDNDIKLIDRSFGFDTAVQEAVRAIKCAKIEATATINGIGVVKLMGRHCGFLTAYASISSKDVDACLIPEVPYTLQGLAAYVRRVVKRKGHCVITVAEGTPILEQDSQTSEAKQAEAKGVDVGMQGTATIQGDVGKWLVHALTRELARPHKQGEEQLSEAPSIKYIDPSYMVRGVPANVGDAQYCAVLASQAVHAAFAGFTGFTVGLINNRLVLIPMSMIAGETRQVDPSGRFWQRVLATTQQPRTW